MAAASGSDAARAALAAPECPDALLYLREWAYALHGRSGVGMDGAAPLAYGTVAAWARLMRVTVAPHEVDALMALDGVLRHPEVTPAPEPDAPSVALLTPAWPKRKVADG